LFAKLVWIGLAFFGADALSAQLRVTYLANEGFLLEGRNKKVLVDALFAEGVRGYATVPDPLQSAVVAGTAPFDGVDLILASHFHADHFDAETVVQHLRANPRALFLSTPQAVGKIVELAEDDNEVLSRVEAVYPPAGKALQLHRAGMDLEVLNLHHGRGGRPPVENLGFVGSLGGQTWLHVGDTEAELVDFQPYSLRERSIDVALLPDWFLDYEEFVQVTRREIRPREVVVMHLATTAAPANYFGKHGNHAQRRRAILESFPDAVILETAGASIVFPRAP